MSQQLTQVSNLLNSYKGNIAAALPKHMTPERVIRIAISAMSGNYLLMQCQPVSVCASVVQASILGLEINSQLGEAYLVPFWNTKADNGPGKSKGAYQAQLMPGYRGLVKLARNTGLFTLIDAQPVHENDEFEAEKGFNPVLRHKWAKGDRGSIMGYYGAYVLRDGGANFEYMSVAEIEAHRDQYSKGAYKTERGSFVLDKDGNKILQGPWKDSPDWMYRKTPLKQVLKLAPASVERESHSDFQTALGLDNAIEAGKVQQFIDLPIEMQPDTGETGAIEGDGGNPKQIAEPQRKSSEALKTAEAGKQGELVTS